MVFDSYLLAEVFECVIVKLFAIVRDEDSGDTEVADDAFPDGVSNFLLCSGGQGFYLNPFNEVVDPYDEELELSHCHGERSHYVKPSLSEWPGSGH